MTDSIISTDEVSASRDGHTFHERWAARRALQLVFPQDDLYAIAVEGLSTSETASPGKEAEDVADLTMYFGNGDRFETCRALRTIQFKYKVSRSPVTASYLKKTLQKFAASLLGYEKFFEKALVDSKVSFSFVTSAEFSEGLWEALRCLRNGQKPTSSSAKTQHRNLKAWCEAEGVQAARLFSLSQFQANTEDLPALNRSLEMTLASWTPGVDSQARTRLHGLEELIREKAGLTGRKNNLVKREDVLDSIRCEPEDLFPAPSEFAELQHVIVRECMSDAINVIEDAAQPIFISADGGVGKTVFIQNLADHLSDRYETVVFDCFGGGSYRAKDQARHLPKTGLLQIVNELAVRGFCDPQLPSDGDRYSLIKAARKRLEQAAETVQTQSSKRGVLVIVDAADNAQLEAKNRGEDDFPSLLLETLSRNPANGLKLVMTARPHRMGDVVGSSEVKHFELPPFSVEETRRFLGSRRENLTALEATTALARSGGNGRVLDYLVTSWEENIHVEPSSVISVEELIEKRCEKIRRDLFVAGWNTTEVNQFFVAISLLPPPIPLAAMCDALQWEQSRVNSAVSDLTPLLEVNNHGAIFRDEPTETYIRETYSGEIDAQQKIADRLNMHQTTSAYAAEALPNFLVMIDDAERAYDLSRSEEFPASIQSEYGRRRLKLMRLHAAFNLAVKERNYDRILLLTMQLGQVASANAKGDEFIRCLPGLSVVLGDQDVSRRLIQDRSGWRGARDCRLTVANTFQGELDEASLHQNRAIGWINWHVENRADESTTNLDQPSTSDFASIVFFSLIKGDFLNVDKNLSRWQFRFALAVSQTAISLVEQYDRLRQQSFLKRLLRFSASRSCRSFALKIALLSIRRGASSVEVKAISRATSALAESIIGEDLDSGFDHEKRVSTAIMEAALSACLHGSRSSASKIIRTITPQRVASYDYEDRFGPSRAWTPILDTCVRAWSANESLNYCHFLPREIEVTRAAKNVQNQSDLLQFLRALKAPSDEATNLRKAHLVAPEKRFSSHECDNIAFGIELIIAMATPLQRVVLARRKIQADDFHEFITLWNEKLRFGIHPNAEANRDQLARSVGLEIAKVFLRHANAIATQDVDTLEGVLSNGNFSIEDKLDVLFLLANHENAYEQVGAFAKSLSQEIRKDNSIDRRAEQYSRLSNAVLPLSTQESQKYFREGLSQLDQMGGDDYEIIYALLRYAAVQRGGWVKPELAHRLMNLCETIFQYEPSKFGWTLFAEATAQSVGYQALFKLLRWADTDVADFSFGMPQLVCFLAKRFKFHPKLATFILLLCEEQGWYDWKTGQGLQELLEVADECDRPAIIQAILSKTSLENPSGENEYLWESIKNTVEKFPRSIDQNTLDKLASSIRDARSQKLKEDTLQDSSINHEQLAIDQNKDNAQKELDDDLNEIISSCDLSTPHTIDQAIRIIKHDNRFMINAQSFVLESLQKQCSYSQKIQFIKVLPNLKEPDFEGLIDILIASVNLWKDSSIYLETEKKEFIKDIFLSRGSDLFSLRFRGIDREIQRIVDFCGDGNFVLDLVLDTLSKEKVQLTGEEWLQIATSLCGYASEETNLAALEELLAGSAARTGDEIGEGRFRKEFLPPDDPSTNTIMIAKHLLGHEDAFIRWQAARSIKDLADLGLHDELQKLLSSFDDSLFGPSRSDSLVSSDLNSSQWSLIGLSRACSFHGSKLSYLRGALENLASRSDIHMTNKVHILRCLDFISKDSESSTFRRKLREDIYTPAKGREIRDGFPTSVKPTCDFIFDYDFHKYQVSSLAQLFGISKGEATDAIAKEIVKRWPDATNMNYFAGSERFHTRNSGRYESYRESVQRNALLHASTTLMKSHPIVERSYDYTETCPWVEWLQEFDISFHDGTFLADRKDHVPAQAKERFVVKTGKTEMLVGNEEVLRKLGFDKDANDIPLAGMYESQDNVSISISAALGPKRGIIGICKSLSKKPYHDIWLPTLDSDGLPNHFIRSSVFEPILWLPENHRVGIDSTDEFATRYAAERPKLGAELSEKLDLTLSSEGHKYFAADNSVVVENRVWGQWRPDRSDYRFWRPNEGWMLFSNSDWINAALAKLSRNLVFHIELNRYSSHPAYGQPSKLRSVYVCLRKADGTFRCWKAQV